MKQEMKTLLIGMIASILLLIAACGSGETTSEDSVDETADVPEETTEQEPVEAEMPTADAPDTEETVVESEETPAEESADYETISVEGCTDSDGGMNYNTAGTVMDVDGIEDTDKCSTNENYSGRLYETYCQESGKYGRETYDCPSGTCMSGACVEAEEETAE